jgi:hypothetical protein
VSGFDLPSFLEAYGLPGLIIVGLAIVVKANLPPNKLMLSKKRSEA